MYMHSAPYYDEIYSFKDYEKESGRLLELIGEHCASDGNQLLDVACGTGNHITYLRDRFDVEGLDQEERFLEIVRSKFPDLTFHQGDMREFDLGERFDVVTCLFSSIGYMATVEDLNRAIANMGRHLVSGGALIVEPWFSEEAWRPNTPHMITVDKPDLKISRVNTSLTEGRLAVMEMHHLIGTPEATHHFVERHEMLLASHDELMNAFRFAGLEPVYLEEGLTWRGLYIGKKS